MARFGVRILGAWLGGAAILATGILLSIRSQSTRDDVAALGVRLGALEAAARLRSESAGGERPRELAERIAALDGKVEGGLAKQEENGRRIAELAARLEKLDGDWKGLLEKVRPDAPVPLPGHPGSSGPPAAASAGSRASAGGVRAVVTDREGHAIEVTDFQALYGENLHWKSAPAPSLEFDLLVREGGLESTEHVSVPFGELRSVRVDWKPKSAWWLGEPHAEYDAQAIRIELRDGSVREFTEMPKPQEEALSKARYVVKDPAGVPLRDLKILRVLFRRADDLVTALQGFSGHPHERNPTAGRDRVEVAWNWVQSIEFPPAPSGK